MAYVWLHLLVSATLSIHHVTLDNASHDSPYIIRLLRTKTHIGGCDRRQAAMSFLYNFYTSPSVTAAAGQLGFATLPGFMATTQLDILKYK